MTNVKSFLFVVFTLFIFSCSSEEPVRKNIVLGSQRVNQFVPLLEGKKVGLLVNQTSWIDDTHLVDTLLSKGVNVVKIFAPEHGFRGDVDAGGIVSDGIDASTGLPVISLYGKNKKPTSDQLQGLDVMIFDIQDVGVRFYTYISSMHYLMEACAENGVELIVLDRPNPNGRFIDGPILDTTFRSFIGMHPIPVLHGLTVGELALMINGEKWLRDSVTCNLRVIPNLNYSHDSLYSLPEKPSPNLPNDVSIRLYPSLCFFEGTNVSVGRGTYFPFQVIGAPQKEYGAFTFTPKAIKGMSMNPKYKNVQCYGLDLRNDTIIEGLRLQPLLDFYQLADDKEAFFLKNGFFNLLAGNDLLKQQIIDGLAEDDIKATWKAGLDAYKKTRAKYLLYP